MEERLFEELQKERRYLINEKERLIRNLEYSPSGTLRVVMNKGKYPQYYLHDSDIANAPKKGIYLKKEKLPLAVKIAQREYDEETLMIIRKRLLLVEKMIEKYKVSLRQEYDKLPEARKRLVDPIVMQDEKYLDVWRNSFSQGGNTFPITTYFYTEKGEQVRSKSEKIIADMLFSKGIPYIYEPMLRIKTQMIYPDFAVLNLRTRQTLYYEHFGMMDDPEYSSRAIEKLNMYVKNDFWFGKNFLYSFETRNIPIDVRIIDQMLTMYCQ